MTTSIITMNNLDAHRAMVIAHRTDNAFVTGMLTASIKALKAELAKRIVSITFLKNILIFSKIPLIFTDSYNTSVSPVCSIAANSDNAMLFINAL